MAEICPARAVNIVEKLIGDSQCLKEVKDGIIINIEKSFKE
jgi:hypothetical protein